MPCKLHVPVTCAKAAHGCTDLGRLSRGARFRDIQCYRGKAPVPEVSAATVRAQDNALERYRDVLERVDAGMSGTGADDGTSRRSFAARRQKFLRAGCCT